VTDQTTNEVKHLTERFAIPRSKATAPQSPIAV